jgi:hypothetical protein
VSVDVETRARARAAFLRDLAQKQAAWVKLLARQDAVVSRITPATLGLKLHYWIRRR